MFEIYPPTKHLFNAFKYFTPAETKVVIIGQCPYHNPGEAMGLSFSVPVYQPATAEKPAYCIWMNAATLFF